MSEKKFRRLDKNDRPLRKHVKCYQTSRRQCPYGSCPIDDRVEESQIDLIVRAKAMFKIKYALIAERAGMKHHPVVNIFNKGRHASKREYKRIYNAMIDLILEKLHMTRHEANERIRRMKEREQAAYNSGDNPQRK